MEDLAFDARSTVLETEAPTHAVGAGTPKIEAEPSLRDIIASEVKADDKGEKPEAPTETKEPEPKDDKATEPKDDKSAEKAEDKDAKPEKARAADGKFAKPAEEAKPEPEAKAEEPKQEGRRIDPPARFLPDAKEHWRNTPRSVQRDIETAFRDHEAEVTRYREVGERYESIRQFDQMAQQSGTTLQAALSNYVGMEQALRTDPVNGFRALLSNMGIEPQQAVSHILGAYGISPQALAQHIANDPGQYVSRAQAPQQPQQRQPDPEVAQLKQQLATMQEQQIITSVVEPFKQSHPRYAELEQDIAFFLSSGKIPESLSPGERLEVAYDMAARINPASHVEDRPSPSQDSPDPARRADDDFSGSKSIKSAPGAVSPDMEPERSGSIRDLLEDELRRQKRA